MVTAAKTAKGRTDLKLKRFSTVINF
jgi:hypothetical protein